MIVADQQHAGEDLVQILRLDHNCRQSQSIELWKNRSDMRLRRQNQIRLGGDDALEIGLEVAADLGFLTGLRRIGGKRVDADDPIVESEREEHFRVAWRNRHDAGW